MLTLLRRYYPGHATLTAIAVVCVALAPLAYLATRAFGSDAALFDILLRLSTLEILARTLALIAAVALTSIALAVPLAWLTTKTDLKLRGVFGAALILPLALPSFVVALTFIELYGPRGIAQGWLEAWFGVTRLPSVYGFVGAWLALVFLTYPYAYLFTRAAALRLDPGLEEAARTLGRGRLRAFWSVSAPLLRPAFLSGGALAALYVLSDFGAVALLRYDTFTAVIFQQYTSSINLSVAAGLSIVLAVLALLLTLGERRGDAVAYRKATATASRPTRPLRLGAWQAPLIILLCLFITAAFASHIAVLIYWLARGALAGAEFAPALQPLLNILWVAIVAAALTVVAAFPVALATARRSGWFYALLRRLTTATFGLPGLVIALALVFLGVNLLAFIYQTIWLLILGYVIAFISIPVATLRSSLLQINPHLEEAAATLGRRQWRRILTVTLPLIMPGVLSGGVIVVLFIMKELPITLVLSPAGYETLAVTIWSNASEGFFAKTALACLTLAVVGLPFAYLVARNSHRLN